MRREALDELYRERPPLVLPPREYALLQAELEHWKAGQPPFDPVTNYGHHENRHERRKAAALNRKKR